MSQDTMKDFFSLLEFLWQHLLVALAIAAVGVPAFILIVRAGRRPQRARLRRLIGRHYSEEKSLVGIGNSISIDDKTGRFAVIDGDAALVCRAEELVSAEFHPSSKESLRASLVVVTTNPALPRFEITVVNFREDKLMQIHARLLALQKQGRASKPPHNHEAAADGIVPAVQELNRSIVALTETTRTLADELHRQRTGHKGA